MRCIISESRRESSINRSWSMADEITLYSDEAVIVQNNIQQGTTNLNPAIFFSDDKFTVVESNTAGAVAQLWAHGTELRLV